MRKVMLSAAAVAGLVGVCGVPAQENGLKYPETKKVEVVDEYHGMKVPDPYRWLEDDVRVNKDVADWVAAQNKVTDQFLAGIPQRGAIKNRLTELWNFERFSAPFKEGGRYFYSKNNGLQNQAVLYVSDTLESEGRVLLDPNSLSKDGTVALSGFVVSDNGKLAAYGLAEAGSDWNTWKVLDIDTGKTLQDELKWVKFSGASWTKDGKGFFYSRFPEPEKDAAFQSLNMFQKLYYHKVGTPQSEDVLIYERKDNGKYTVGGGVTEDGKYLLISVGDGTTSRKSSLAVKDLSDPNAKVLPLVDNFDSKFNLVGNVGSLFYFVTDNGAKKNRVITIDVKDPAKDKWKTVVAETADTLEDCNFVGEHLVCVYLQDAKTVVKLHKPDGVFVRNVELPGIGTAGGFGGKQNDSETFYAFSSFNTPPSTYRYDIKTGQTQLLKQAKVKFDPAQYTVKQVKYKSKDGTEVPMFICHRTDLILNGTNPTLLYGYGGFNIPLTPGFSVSRIQWMEMGGVLAVANLRGGGEYGEDWHRAGTKLKKQNVFDDFIAAAEYLIAEKYTSSPKLAIQGGSNGGLLVGACMAQRPDLFGACLPAVGVMDMLRFQKFTAGRYWVDDYGSSDNKEEFAALYKYSPYHNLKPGTKYPATMVTTADTDDRVVPGHSFKFTAMLQYCHAGGPPVLARIETKAGHGAGKPTSKMIEEVADQWAFLVKVLDVKDPKGLK